jgi:hypothetical protein
LFACVDDTNTRNNSNSNTRNNTMAPADETPPAASDTAAAANSNSKQLQSARSSSGMEASVLRFKDVSFTVGSGEHTKTILSDINAKVKWGQVLART